MTPANETTGAPGGDSDKRRARRQRVLKAAFAAFNNEFSSIPCVVRNISETGAWLEFSDSSMVPSRFVLHVEIDGYKVDCERVWQHGKSCGVRFLSERRPTRVYRLQVLSTSENALSEGFKRELAMREAQSRVQPADSAAAPNAAPRAGPQRPVFGKRG